MFWAGLGVGLVVGLILHIAAVVLSELRRSLKGTVMKRFRSAITGRFVSLWYAILHPFTTIAEKIRRK